MFRGKIIEYNQLCQSKKLLYIVLFSIAFVVWLMYILSMPLQYTDIQSRKDASGYEFEYGKRFLYFYYYTGHFPLTTTDSPLVYSTQGAKNQIVMHGNNLLMEYKHWSRLGEHARIWCLMPAAWWRMSPQYPTLTIFNALLFAISLMTLYHGFYRSGNALAGILSLFIIFITPFFWYEIFENQNIFALLHCVFFIIIGFVLPYILQAKKLNISTIFFLTIIAMVIGVSSEMRNETIVLLAVFIIAILFFKSPTYLQKLGWVIWAVCICFASKKSVRFYFEKKYEVCMQLVRGMGGHVYTGNRIAGHNFWHPIFCGLGDFDTQKGYAWHDTVAYHYAMPLLQKQVNMPLYYSGNYHLDNYYDSAHRYYIKFDEIPQYEQIIKEKVLHDIQSEPLWYIEILGKRFLHILYCTLPFPFLGFMAILASIYFVTKRKYDYLKIILLALPLSANALLVYAEKGATYNGMLGFMFLICLLLALCKGEILISRKH